MNVHALLAPGDLFSFKTVRYVNQREFVIYWVYGRVGMRRVMSSCCS